MKRNALCSWSGGKDSCYALMQAIKEGYTPSALLNVLNEEGKISRSHGIPRAILEAQAAQAGLPIKLIQSSWNDYESNFTNALQEIKDQYKTDYAVFGDIDLQAHRDWEEKVCGNVELTALLPLWQRNRKALVYEMLAAGIETIIVSCNNIMGERFLGRKIDNELIAELESMGVDVCGENGEYHTLVLNCPLFANGIHVKISATAQHQDYWFCDLKLST